MYFVVVYMQLTFRAEKLKSLTTSHDPTSGAVVYTATKGPSIAAEITRIITMSLVANITSDAVGFPSIRGPIIETDI